MDTVLIIGGRAAQVWRNTRKHELDEPVTGVLVETPPGSAVFGMFYTDTGFVSPPHQPSTADDVRREAQRRIMTVMGTSDMEACIVRQLNAQMRASELLAARIDGQPWSDADAREAAELQAIAAAIRAIRAASNAMESAPPENFADDEHWPPRRA